MGREQAGAGSLWPACSSWRVRTPPSLLALSLYSSGWFPSWLTPHRMLGKHSNALYFFYKCKTRICLCTCHYFMTEFHRAHRKENEFHFDAFEHRNLSLVSLISLVRFERKLDLAANMVHESHIFKHFTVQKRSYRISNHIKVTITSLIKQGAPRFELETSWSAVKCSTTELYPLFSCVKNWYLCLCFSLNYFIFLLIHKHFEIIYGP